MSAANSGQSIIARGMVPTFGTKVVNRRDGSNAEENDIYMRRLQHRFAISFVAEQQQIIGGEL